MIKFRTWAVPSAQAISVPQGDRPARWLASVSKPGRTGGSCSYGSQSTRQRYHEVVAREPQGRCLGLPYNWRRPTRDEAGEGVWDPAERRILTPKNYGWGYGVNFAALKRRFTSR